MMKHGKRPRETHPPPGRQIWFHPSLPTWFHPTLFLSLLTDFARFPVLPGSYSWLFHQIQMDFFANTDKVTKIIFTLDMHPEIRSVEP